jgi:crotonobetainyl-CoA:carnitine CoA-transferase CaiB-like acyl-CoA transferase
VLSTLNEIFAERDAAHWISCLEDQDVPVSPVNTMGGVFANPQIQHRQVRRTIEDSDGNSLDVLANPVRFSATPLDSYAAPPRLGQHTHEVLTSVLGKSDADIDKLRACHAI